MDVVKKIENEGGIDVILTFIDEIKGGVDSSTYIQNGINGRIVEETINTQFDDCYYYGMK